MNSHSKYSHYRRRWYWLFLLVPIFILGIAALITWLWNSLIPPIFGLGTITYWQAFGLFILSRILFGGFRGHGSSRYGHYGRMSHFRKKWMNMTEEERQKYKEEWKKCCSPGKTEE